jgi:hypothetical protein
MEDHNLAEKEVNAEGVALLRMLALNSDSSGYRLQQAIEAEGLEFHHFIA